jgi:hypothetical protein
LSRDQLNQSLEDFLDVNHAEAAFGALYGGDAVDAWMLVSST